MCKKNFQDCRLHKDEHDNHAGEIHDHHHDHHHCHCHHETDDSSEDSSEKKGTIIKIALSALLLIAAIWIEKTFSLPTWQLLLVYLIPYLIAGYETIREAIENTTHGEVFDENFLMTIATLGALCIGFLPNSEPQFAEAVFVMLFFQIGELFEEIAEGNSRKSIAHLLNIRPDHAHVLRNEVEETVSPTQVQIGETIVVKPGEKIPMDGIVTSGSSNLDTTALTGESVPKSVKPDDEVLSGCINLSGLLHIRVEKAFGDSTASKIIELVENASENKSRQETFIRKFAHIYTPIVVIVAIALAFIPPFFSNLGYLDALHTWIYRALMFMVVSCPCALVLSVPLAFFGGIGAASKKGILVKGANYMEPIANLKTIVFDKTGTLTHGVFKVTAIHPTEINETELLHLAAHVERHSSHPIAMSLKEAYPNEADDCLIENIEELAGQGVKATVNNRTVCVGNDKLMNAEGIEWRTCDEHKHGTIIHVSVDGRYAGHIVISDEIKETSADAIKDLKSIGVKKAIMLTGDHASAASVVANRLGLDAYFAELLPADKVSKVEELETNENKPLAFVGDGINDAPVLARADIGIAMGALGSEAAIEAADLVLMDDNPAKITKAVTIARKTLKIAHQNIVFSIGVKILVLLLAAFGIANMWMAVFADVGVTVLAVLNSMRMLKTN